MAIPDQFKGRFIYQFTHLKNLPDILKHGLLSYNEKKRLGISHVSIAEHTIQARRAKMPVPCGEGGVVHDYTPFYFCSRSSMLLKVVNAKNVDQLFLIYLAVPIGIIDQPDVVFTSASANTEPPPEFFTDPADLSKLDWNSIDSKKWSMPSDLEKQARMAEALIHNRLAPLEIAFIVVWNESIKKYVTEIYDKAELKPPPIVHDGYGGKYFYFTNFYEGGKVSIVTGPMCLSDAYKQVVQKVKESRKASLPAKPLFASVPDAIRSIANNFCVLGELNDICNLETDNGEHHESVGRHTKTVVEKLQALEGFRAMQEPAQNVLMLSAYFHDIGKAKSPRIGGKQKTDPDHPVRGLRLLERILYEEISDISEEDIRRIAMLVAYHDLVGDVIGKGRDRSQILEIVESAEDFELLATLSMADVSSLVPTDMFAAALSKHAKWLRDIQSELPELRAWVLGNLKKAAP